jgi:hypothetical protein
MRPPLERSTLEFYVGFIVAIVSLVVPMTWWLKAILAILVFGAWADISFNASLVVSRNRLQKIGICAIGFLGLGALLLPPIWSDFHSVYPMLWPFEKPPQVAIPAATPSPVAGPSVDYTIHVECEQSGLPLTFPESGVVHTVEFGVESGHNDRAAIIPKIGKPGEVIKWLPEQQGLGAKCTLQNNSDTAFSRFSTTLKIEERLLVVIQGEPKKGVFDGPTISAADWVFKIPEIGKYPPSNVYELYIWNGGKNFINITNPITASLQLVGTRSMIEVRLQGGTFDSTGIFPHIK